MYIDGVFLAKLFEEKMKWRRKFSFDLGPVVTKTHSRLFRMFQDIYLTSYQLRFDMESFYYEGAMHTNQNWQLNQSSFLKQAKENYYSHTFTY